VNFAIIKPKTAINAAPLALNIHLKQITNTYLRLILSARIGTLTHHIILR